MLQWPFYLSVFRLREKLLQYYNGLVDLFSDSMLGAEAIHNQQKVESSRQYIGSFCLCFFFTVSRLSYLLRKVMTVQL
jgi:hypothetical protein